MSKSSFIIGLIAALLVHAVLFIGNSKSVSKQLQVESNAQKVAKVAIPHQTQLQERIQEHREDKFFQKRQEPQVEYFQEVVKATGPDFSNSLGDFADKQTDDSLPTLRLIWDSPEYLIKIAKALGLRVLPVNSINKPIGELRFERDILVGKFYGRLNNYSNRVRTISAQFFGPQVLSQCPETVRYFWVVVPASVDKEWVKVQKQALHTKGLTGLEVSYMEAKIVPTGSGFKLIITKIVTV